MSHTRWFGTKLLSFGTKFLSRWDKVIVPKSCGALFIQMIWTGKPNIRYRPADTQREL